MRRSECQDCPQMFTPVLTRRTFEEAVEQIAEKVKPGELHVGDRLPSERELAAHMQISRPTLREAIKVLQDSGLIDVRRGAGGGIFVATELVPPDLRRAPPRHPHPRGRPGARGAPAARAARRPARRHARARDDFEAMAAHDRRPARARRRGLDPRDGREDRFLALDVRFHLALARATGNYDPRRPDALRLPRPRDRARHDHAPRRSRTGRSTSTSARWPRSAPATSTASTR